MSELAEKLILENLKTKNPMLDLGFCGLNGTENELYASLKDTKHLKMITFSDTWTEYSLKKQEWVDKFSKNDYDNLSNVLIAIPDDLPTSLQKLILRGHIEFDRYDMRFINYRFRIKDFSVLNALKDLKVLDLSYGNVENISFLKNLKKLQSISLSANPVKNIDILVNLKHLKAIQLDMENLTYPPIWYVYLKNKKGKLGDYLHLSELPQVEKIWELLKTENRDNIKLAKQLTKGQDWTNEEFEMYKSLLYY